jgi:hypothetical protein
MSVNCIFGSELACFGLKLRRGDNVGNSHKNESIAIGIGT